MKKNWSILIAGALVASVFTIAPAAAAPDVPAEPLITDPTGDANYINDGQVVPIGKDNTTPADAGSVSDLIAVWMSDDADNVYAHFQTEAPGPATTALFYRLRVDPGVGATCMWFQGTAPGAGNPAADPTASLRTSGDCGAETVSEGAEFIQEEGPDGTGIHTVKIPRALNPVLTDGKTLATPWVDVTNFLGAATAPTIDNTEMGTDYVIGSGNSGAPDGEAPEAGEGSDEPKKEKCKKYKKKKKRKACKKRNKKAQEGSQDPGSPEDPETPEAPSGDVCPAYVPGENGAAAETTVVTDEATAEAPLEIVVPTEAGLPVAPTEVFQNVQVDTANENAGLYVRIEFFDDEDLDLYLRYPDDSVAAQAAGFNPVSAIPTNPVFNTNGQGQGGHSEMGAEQVDGVLTPDCGGYTAQFDEYYGFGGERTVKLWLGDATWDPEAQAPIEQPE